MAYAVKYILQFTSDRGNEVRIEVLKKDYQGEVIYKSLGGSPSLSIEQGDGAIKGSSLVFAMQADIEGELQELYTTDNKQFKVNMYRNEVLSWQGYILPELYSEEYVDAPYDVSVTATDQLATLKAITYQREDVNVSLSTIIEDILSFTQISVPVTYHQNLSALRKGEVPMLVDSHISQAAYNGHSCYDVLNNILLSCNCCIMQINGEWLITSLTNSTTNYYTAGVTQVREHKALGQLGVGEVYPAGTLTMVNNPALKGAKVEYAHMLRNSFLVNADCVDREGWNYTPDSRNPIDIPGEREAFGKIFKAYCWELHPVNIRENNSLQLWQEVSLEKDERNYYDLSVKTLFGTNAKLLLMAVTYLGSDGVERRLTSEGWIETWDKSDVNYYIQITGTNKNAGLDAIADIEQYEMSTVQFALPPVDGTMRVGFINSTTDYAEPLASAPIYVSQVYLTVSGVTGQECTTEVEPNATQEQQDVLLAYGDTFESENAYKLGLNTLKKSSGENITSWWLDNVNFSSYYDTMLQEFSRYFGVKKAQLQGIIMGKDVLSDMYADVFSGRVMRLLSAQVDLLADEASVTVEEVITTTVDFDTVIYATNNTNSFGSSSGGGAGTSGGASSTAGESLLGVQSDGDVYVKDGRALVGSEARFEKMALPSSAPDKRAEQKTYIYSSDTSRGAIDIAKIVKYIEEQEKIWVLDSANGVVRTQYNIVSTQEIISGRRASGASSDVTGGGGISQVTAQMIVDALGYIPYSSQNPSGYITSSALNGYAKISDIPSLSGYATQVWVEGKKYITGITSAMVTAALGFTPYNSASFTKANIKSTLGIADWALAASKPSYAWSEIISKPSFATVATSGKYSDLSGVPTSLPASDVYAWAKAATKPTYTASEVGALSTSGGTLTGNLQIGNNDNTAFNYLQLVRSSHFARLNSSDVRAMLSFGAYNNGTATIEKALWLGDNGLQYVVNNTAVYDVFHTGNFNPASYLPLSGGTMKSAYFSPLAVDRDSDSGAAAIGFTRKSAALGYIGFNDTSGPKWFNTSFTEYTLIHSGNIGSQSVDKANVLKGIYPAVSGTNDLYNTELLIKYHAGFSPDFGNVPSSNSWENGLLEIGLHSGGATAQFYFSRYKALYYRSSTDDAWNRIAYTSDNVASATKLQAARTIWGQSFDGTSDINGNLTLGYNVIRGANSENALELSSDSMSLGYSYRAKTTTIYGGMVRFAKEGAYTVLINSSGNVLIGTTSDNGAKLQVNGNLTATGEVISSRRASSSDRRLKDNITYLDTTDCLAMVRYIRPAEWDWKDNGKHSIGFIAQDVEHLMPYAVTKIKDEVLGQRLNLQYDQFFAPVVGAIQCLDIKVENHETRLKRLETENVELKNRLSKYETVWQ